MAELALVLDDDFDSPRLPAGFTPMSAGDRQRYSEWWQALTPRERLEAYRQGDV